MRELREETGITTPVGPEIAKRDVTFKTPDGDSVDAEERLFAVHVQSSSVDESGQERFEAKTMVAYHWWSMDELYRTDEVVYPEDLLKIIKAYLTAN